MGWGRGEVSGEVHVAYEMRSEYARQAKAAAPVQLEQSTCRLLRSPCYPFPRSYPAPSAPLTAMSWCQANTASSLLGRLARSWS